MLNQENQQAVRYRLGIDIGTASLGLVAYEIDAQNEPIQLIHMDTVIFREPLQPKSKALLNIKRRNDRLHRRLLDRTKRRQKKLFYLSMLAGITQEQYKNVASADIFRLRAIATTEKIELHELFRVLAHLGKNRGYKGDLNSAGTVKKGIKETQDCMESYGVKLLGQLYYKLQQENQDTANKWRILTQSKDANATYVKRDMVEEEFNLIMDTQAKFHEVLSKSFESLGGDFRYFIYEKQDPKKVIKQESLDSNLNRVKANIHTLRDAIFQTIFYQRPIYWDKTTIKKCELTNEYVVSRASLAFQEWRIETRLNNLTWKHKTTPNNKLKPEHKEKLRTLLNSKAIVKFAEIYEYLKVENETFTDDRSAKTGEDKGIKGNVTLAFFSDAKKLKDVNFKNSVDIFKKLSAEEKEGLIQYLSLLSSTDELYQHEDNTIKNLKEFCGMKAQDSINKILSFLKEFRNYKDIALFSQMGVDKQKLDNGRAEYSISAIKTLLPYIKDGIKEYDAIKQAYPNININKTFNEIIADITNPIVKRSLRELKNTLDYTYYKLGGKPSAITIELTREMKTPPSERANLEKMNKTSATEKAKYTAELIDKGIPVTYTNIEKYILYKEQEFKCAYSGNTMKVENFYELEIEHIIPKAQGGGNARYNKVLVLSYINHNKGSYTPYQAYQNKIAGMNWEHIEKLAEAYNKKGSNKQEKDYFKKKAKLLLHEGDIKSIDERFMERANTETAFIGQVLTTWLQQDIKDGGEGKDVIVSRGRLTAHLRHIWGLDNLLAKIRIAENKPLISLINNKPQFLDYEIYRECKNILSAKDREQTQEFLQQHNKQSVKDCQHYKRSDHRHHIVDAAVIGLTTRSILAQASNFYANYGTLQKVTIYNKKDGQVTQIEAFAVKDTLNLRNTLQEKLTNYVVWHKPDRHINMSLFQETAYALKKDDEQPSGKKRIIKSKALSDFVAKNPIDVIKKINEIVVGEEIKKSIIQQFEKRYDELKAENESKPVIDKIKTTEDIIRIALSGSRVDNQEDSTDGIFFPQNVKKNKVKKVRCYFKKNGVVMYSPDKDYYNKANNAVYINDGYSLALIEGNQAKPITHFKALELTKQGGNLQDSPDKRYIYLNDVVYNKLNNNFYVVTQFNEGGGIGMKLNTEPFSFAVYQNDINKPMFDYLKKHKEESNKRVETYNKIKGNEFYKFLSWKDAHNLVVMKNREDIAKIKRQ